jgi:hypothetical protein
MGHGVPRDQKAVQTGGQDEARPVRQGQCPDRARGEEPLTDRLPRRGIPRAAVELVSALPAVEYFLKDSDSIAVGLTAEELETAKAAITYYNLMRRAFPQDTPDHLLMGVVEQTAKTAREMVRFGARLKPRMYSVNKARRRELVEQARSAREPEYILLRGVMAELYPGQEYPERYPQGEGGEWPSTVAKTRSGRCFCPASAFQ